MESLIPAQDPLTSDRLPKQGSLAAITPQHLQNSHLRRILHPIGHTQPAEIANESQSRANDGQASVPGLQVPGECPVDLDCVEGKFPQH